MLLYLRLIRLPNLLMIALSMFLVRYFMILPAFQFEYIITGEFPEHMDRLHFLLLTGATLVIAAAGYIINDVFDVTADQYNRPGKNCFENKISVKAGKRAYYLLAIIGSAIGAWLGLSTGKPALAFIHFFTAASLWMYSSYYKRTALSGNILIAFLSSLMVMLPGLFEPAYYPNIIYLAFYGIFSFFISLIREIIKDMEDVEGDTIMNCRTLPIRYGLRRTKYFTLILLGILLAALSTVIYYYFHESTVISWWNLLLIFVLPLIGLAYLISTAEDKRDFHFASLFAKIYMTFGIISIFPFWYYFLR